LQCVSQDFRPIVRKDRLVIGGKVLCYDLARLVVEAVRQLEKKIESVVIA